MGLNSSLYGIKRAGILLLPRLPSLDGMLVHRRVPNIMIAGTHLKFKPGPWRETLWSKDSCLRNNTTAATRLESVTFRSKVQCTNLWSTAPPGTLENLTKILAGRSL